MGTRLSFINFRVRPALALLLLASLALPANAQKISSLPAATSANGTDELPANQAGTTRKLTVSQILAGLGVYVSGATVNQGLLLTGSTLGLKDCAARAEGACGAAPARRVIVVGRGAK